ncbi:MAG: SET domain-containing protein [Candidatus Methylacidiphilales bacterium]
MKPLRPEASPLWEIRSSSIHGSGLFALTLIPKETRILEYVGEKIDKLESVRRAHRQLTRSRRKNDGAVYIFELNRKYDIDGNVAWNPARLINHCCSPNCQAVNHRGRIWIQALRKILPGEELSYNYGYEIDHYEEHPCRCGSPHCAGYIVRRDQWKKLKALITKTNVERKS